MNLFTKESFNIFQIDGLDERMKVIRRDIQPVFQDIHDLIVDELNQKADFDHEFHIAQHLRRTKNPPESTWAAFGGDSRGYKKYPHLQLMINEEYIFIGLAMIDNPLYEKEIAREFLDHPNLWDHLTTDFKISKDHTKTPLIDLTEENMTKALERVINVKKGEIMVGRMIEPDSDLLDKPDAQLAFIKESFDQIMPLYKRAIDLHFELDQENS